MVPGQEGTHLTAKGLEQKQQQTGAMVQGRAGGHTSPSVRKPATSITVTFSPFGSRSGLFTGSGRACAPACRALDGSRALRNRGRRADVAMGVAREARERRERETWRAVPSLQVHAAPFVVSVCCSFVVSACCPSNGGASGPSGRCGVVPREACDQRWRQAHMRILMHSLREQCSLSTVVRASGAAFGPGCGCL